MRLPKLPQARRFFQPQIPQLFRPKITSLMAKTVGRINLEAAATGLTAVAYWARLARWCSTHPTLDANRKDRTKGRDWLYRSIIERERLGESAITYLEFGVFRGASLRLWIEALPRPESRFVGFDTFTGLPERWRPTEPLGHFNANGQTPDIRDPRCSFEIGLFQDTLPRFVDRTDLSGRLVINMDADMFTSTLFVLTTLAPYLKSGDLIFFDEFSCPLDEFRAFEEFVRCFRIKYELLAAVYGYTRVCIKIASSLQLSDITPDAMSRTPAA
jgi:O-methyltransferase